jgi:hypothetical protein
MVLIFSMLDKKYRRIKNIMGKYYYRPKCYTPIGKIREFKLNKLFGKKTKPLEVFVGVNPLSTEHKERMEVFNYFYKLGKDDDYISTQWWKTQSERRGRGSEYNKEPKRERKDNLNPNTNTVNWGSGGDGSWYSRIRVPSKKRKNKMKNFKKMFPNYKIK